MPFIQSIGNLYLAGSQQVGKAAHLFNLAIRLYVANVFMKSGLTKIQSWGTATSAHRYGPYAVAVGAAIAQLLAEKVA